MNDLMAVLNGAAMTIQTSWRNYILRRDYSPGTRSLMNRHVKSSLRNRFLCDVEILVESESFACHSLVLSVSSAYFRRVLAHSTLDHTGIYKFAVRTSARCWRIIQDYIYGYDVVIATSALDTITRLARQLELDDMLDDLTNTTSDLDDDQLVCLSPRQPVHLITDYYTFVKCVVYFYTRGKLDHPTTVHYLSFEFVDYARMTDRQLRACIAWFKTKLKLKNSSLLAQLIELYARNSHTSIDRSIK